MANTNEPNTRQVQNGRVSSHKGNSNRRQTNGFDDATNDKLREIESFGEPLSIAETISRELGSKLKVSNVQPDSKNSKSQKSIDVTDLQQMSIEELTVFATDTGVENIEGQSRRELLLEILKHWVKTCGLMFGQGTLQILPDGFAGRCDLPKKTNVTLRCYELNRSMVLTHPIALNVRTLTN